MVWSSLATCVTSYVLADMLFVKGTFDDVRYRAVATRVSRENAVSVGGSDPNGVVSRGNPSPVLSKHFTKHSRIAHQNHHHLWP